MKIGILIMTHGVLDTEKIGTGARFAIGIHGKLFIIDG